MCENININNIGDITERLRKDDFFVNIDSYSKSFSNSQVVKFFERYGVSFTKTMIQNYIKVGLLPGPNESRFYSREHLYMLAIISDLKNIYSINDMKELFSRVLNDAAFDNMDIEMKELYNIYKELYNYIYNGINTEIIELTEKADDMAGSEKSSCYFALAAGMMLKSVMYKQIADILLRDCESI